MAAVASVRVAALIGRTVSEKGPRCACRIANSGVGTVPLGDICQEREERFGFIAAENCIGIQGRLTCHVSSDRSKHLGVLAHLRAGPTRPRAEVRPDSDGFCGVKNDKLAALVSLSAADRVNSVSFRISPRCW